MSNTTSARETTRLTITLSKRANHALRSYLGAHGMKKGDLSQFIEDAVRWRIFHETVDEVRRSFADIPPDELEKAIEDSVQEVRAARYREHLAKP